TTGRRFRSRLGQPGVAGTRDSRNRAGNCIIAARKGRRAPVIAASLLIFTGSGAAENSDITIETLNAVIESRDQQRLRVVSAAEGQPAVLFKPAQGAWDWSATSKLFIPVENPGDELLTLRLRVEGPPGRSLSGKISMAPQSTGDLAILLDAPLPR